MLALFEPRAAHAFRSSHQSQDSQTARPRSAADAARSRRRGDRVNSVRFAALHMSPVGRYCCKSPKSPGANFPAVKNSDQRPPIDVASITLPGSPASFSSDDEVPHIFTWKSPVQPKEILIASEKRLLQQNRH